MAPSKLDSSCDWAAVTHATTGQLHFAREFELLEELRKGHGICDKNKWSRRGPIPEPKFLTDRAASFRNWVSRCANIANAEGWETPAKRDVP